MFNNLRELITSMPDEKSCRGYLIKERWNGVLLPSRAFHFYPIRLLGPIKY